MKSKEQKREEAKVRQMEYDNLTTEQKIDRLDRGYYVAKREKE